MPRYSVTCAGLPTDYKKEVNAFAQYILLHPELGVKYHLPTDPLTLGIVECGEGSKMLLKEQFGHVGFTEEEKEEYEPKVKEGECPFSDPEYRYKRFKMPEDYKGEIKVRIGKGWADMCLYKSELDKNSDDWKNGFNHAMSVVSFWLDLGAYEKFPIRTDRVGMQKSALLGRLCRLEEIRRKPCPKHRGHMWCAFGLGEDFNECGCNGTGWLPNEPGEEG